MTSLLLSNSDVIRSIFTEKTQENAEKTQNPGNLLPPITQKIAEFLSLVYWIPKGPPVVLKFCHLSKT